ncbi:hypothetical protein CU097_014297 [Rhizopus azygosporus]|uniref:sphingomyelin phosphodiesterase n=1 Tax=Rhizopus azygosporus TaxID=86630 RepID=A0A367KHB9_RHIAZ|nr:hypothetical protein CU097_014297 [Rhizopus azygosporus]
MNSSRESFESFASFDTAAYASFDTGRSSDETSETVVMLPIKKFKASQDDDHYENAPLLDETGAMEGKDGNDTKVDSLLYLRWSGRRHCNMFRWQTSKNHSTHDRLRPYSYCCCFRTKKFFIITCLVLFILPLVSFVLFSLVYFSPVHLPAKSLEVPNYATSTVRLLTLNIFMRPPGVKNNANDYKEQRLDYIIEHILPSYDIITFQEAFAFANRRVDKLLVKAYDQGFYHHVASPRHYPWELAGDGGLLILSRFPIVQANRIEFSRGVHADWLSYKGALHALVQLNNNSLLHVYTTHTQASYDNAGSFNLDDTKVRLSQFARVHQFIAETAKDDDYPILLMGDLNVDAAVHNQSIPINVRPHESSLAYKMMMDVLRGKGIDLAELTNGTDSSILYSHPWRLDTLNDAVYKTFGYHPVTFGDYKTLDNGIFIPAETSLTSHNQLLTVQSIDRLLWADRKEKHSMKLTNITVEPFFVENKTFSFTQISDHYGLSAQLQLL